MSVKFGNKTVNFSDCGGELASKSGSVNFEKDVVQATAVMKGFEVKLNYGEKKIQLVSAYVDNVKFEGKNVSFNAYLGIKDQSGIFDDPYGGFVDVVVIATHAD